jgi:sugar lactone lactonase YvrE
VGWSSFLEDRSEERDVKASDRVAEGILFPEGLAWEDATETLVSASVQTATVFRIWPQERRKETIAELGRGGANNLTLAVGGGIVVCQNGGVDAGPPMAARYPEMEPLPAQESTTAGLVYVSLDGKASYILEQGVNAPNDLTVDGGGDLVFTDPGNPFHNPRPEPRLMRFSREGSLSVIADGFDYCNGIFAEGDSLLVTDHGGVLRFAADGSREWVIRYDDGNVDGLTVDSSGRIYVARQANGGVDVIEDGRVVEFLELPSPAMITNVCFGGTDRTWLFVTDARNGSVSVFADMPVPGARVADWTPPQPSMDG